MLLSPSPQSLPQGSSPGRMWVAWVKGGVVGSRLVGNWVRIKGRQGPQMTEGGPLSEYDTPLLHPLPLTPAWAAPRGSRRRELTSHRKGFSPECCSECTLRDMLRLKDFPQVSQVKGMSLVWATGRAPWPSQLWGTPPVLGPASQPLSQDLGLSSRQDPSLG